MVLGSACKMNPKRGGILWRCRHNCQLAQFGQTFCPKMQLVRNWDHTPFPFLSSWDLYKSMHYLQKEKGEKNIDEQAHSQVQIRSATHAQIFVNKAHRKAGTKK